MVVEWLLDSNINFVVEMEIKQPKIFKKEKKTNLIEKKLNKICYAKKPYSMQFICVIVDIFN